MAKKMDWGHAGSELRKVGLGPDSIDSVIHQMQRIDALRNEKGAVILAHYYQILPIQLLANVAGDSLALAQASARMGRNDGQLVLSSTVHFMAEMVKLLSPEKKVVLPDLEASCSIAEGINGATIRRIRKDYPSAAIVGYINTTAEAKAEMDSVCTSANAATIVSRIEGNPVIMLPDHYFARNIIDKVKDTGRDYLIYKGISEGSIVLEDARTMSEQLLGMLEGRPKLDKGTCIVHEQFTPESARYMKSQGILVLAHPEVKPEVAAEADMVGGTARMIDYVGKTTAKKILYLTECDLAAPLREAHPDREFITPCILCPYMKKNTLDNVLYSLQNEEHEIKLDPATEEGARRSLEKMFELMR